MLGAVEPRLATESRIVTAVRVNGVEEPAFRDPTVLERTLHEEDAVDMDSSTAGELAVSALTDAIGLMPSLCEAAGQLAPHLRTSTAPAAASDLGPLAEGLTLLVALVQAADGWASAGAIEHAPWLGEDLVTIAGVIDALEAAQRAEDWIAVADGLEFELVPAVQAWRAVLTDSVPAVTGPQAASDASRA